MFEFLNVPKRQLLLHVHRHLTTNAAGVTHQSRGRANIKKYVIISESNDIFTNLAVEDWLYNNWNFRNTHLLMLWRNDPCVVIGKFQNPWLESNVKELGFIVPDGIKLARRNSGGGTVYHDRGNLNLTFFTPREHYKRVRNLELIANAILKWYNVKVDISPREDLTVGNYKVSGTAAKLARSTAYHHCTLLLNARKDVLRRVLRKPEFEIETNATRSIKSQVMNLCDVSEEINVDDLMTYVGRSYMQTETVYRECHDCVRGKTKTIPHEMQVALIEKICNADPGATSLRTFRPNEDDFPGITEIRDTLSSWEWVFGKCPTFTASKSFVVPRLELRSAANLEKAHSCPVKVELQVANGFTEDFKILSPGHEVDDISMNEAIAEFTGRKFTEQLFEEIYNFVCMQSKDMVVKDVV